MHNHGAGGDGEQQTTMAHQDPNASIKYLATIAAGDQESDLATERPNVPKHEGGSMEEEGIISERSDFDAQ